MRFSCLFRNLCQFKSTDLVCSCFKLKLVLYQIKNLSFIIHTGLYYSFTSLNWTSDNNVKIWFISVIKSSDDCWVSVSAGRIHTVRPDAFYLLRFKANYPTNFSQKPCFVLCLAQKRRTEAEKETPAEIIRLTVWPLCNGGTVPGSDVELRWDWTSSRCGVRKWILTPPAFQHSSTLNWIPPVQLETPDWHQAAAESLSD